MRSHAIKFIIVLVSFPFVKITAQDSTRALKKDTVNAGLIKISPYLVCDKAQSGLYVQTIHKTKLLDLSSGVNILNVLRGHVPGLTIPPDFSLGHFSGMRLGRNLFVNDALILIDGIPNNSYVGNYINMNTFDFSSITAFSNINYLNFFGGGNSGAFVLNTKTAEGIERPTFDFNTFVTQCWRDIPATQVTPAKRVSAWYVSNAISFSQDFGIVDTRISYTLQKRPDEVDGSPYVHNLKLNTGFEIGDRLDIRLIADGRLGREDRTSKEGAGPTLIEWKTRLERKLLSANLSGRYRILNWVSLSAQGLMSKNESGSDGDGNNFHLERNISYSRRYVSVYLDMRKQFAEIATVSGFIGVSDERQKINDYRNNQYPNTPPSTDEEVWEMKNESVIAQASVSFGNLFHFSGHWKSGSGINYDNYNFANDEEKSPAHSLSAAFTFGHFLKTPVITLAKLRVSGGTHTVLPLLLYPVLDGDAGAEFILPENKKFPYQVSNFEMGLDLGFLHSRLLATFNYFENEEAYNLPPYTFIGITDYSRKGWEIELRGWPIRKSNFSFETAILLSRGNSKTYRLGGSAVEHDPIVTSRWFNHLSYRSLILTLLIESFDNYPTYILTVGNEKISFTKLREVSLGFNVPKSFFANTFIDSGAISITGRNLVNLSGSDSDNAQELNSYLFVKSVSASLNLTF